jgi:hypothetical protein
MAFRYIKSVEIDDIWAIDSLAYFVIFYGSAVSWLFNPFWRHTGLATLNRSAATFGNLTSHCQSHCLRFYIMSLPPCRSIEQRKWHALISNIPTYIIPFPPSEQGREMVQPWMDSSYWLCWVPKIRIKDQEHSFCWNNCQIAVKRGTPILMTVRVYVVR